MRTRGSGPAFGARSSDRRPPNDPPCLRDLACTSFGPHPAGMLRWLLAPLLMLIALAGCAKTELADTSVRAGTLQELTAFRSELGSQWAAAELATFDTALQELRLEALNKDIAPASAREDYMRGEVNGLTVQAVRVRGWQARRVRLQAEIALLSGMERDLLRQQESKGTTESNAARLASAREVLARLQRDLAATESQLNAWGAGS